METRQAPHKVLTEEQIKDIVCKNQMNLSSLKQLSDSKLEFINMTVRQLEEIHFDELSVNQKMLIEMLNIELNSLSILLDSAFQDMNEKNDALKRHFCPEKFSEMMVTMSELTDLMCKSYAQNAGSILKMFPPEIKTDLPTTDEVKYDHPA